MGDDGETTSDSNTLDGGYGWICIIATFIISAFTWGQVSLYSVYLFHYLSYNDFPRGTSMDFAFIGGLDFCVAMLMAPVAVFMSRIYGMKTPMIIGTILLPAGFFGASYARRIWQLYLTQGVLVGMGVGFIYIPSIPVVSQWFSKRRSLANGICSAGSGVGGLTMCFATEAMIQRIGVSWTLRVTAVIVLFMNLLAVLLIRNRNNYIHPNQRVFDFQLARRYDIFLLLLWSFFSMFGYVTLTFSLPEYGRSIGLSDSKASSIAAFISLGMATGRPLIGVASDAFGIVRVTTVLTFSCGFLCFALWIPARSYEILALFALLSGTILGIFWAVISPLATAVAGLKELPSLLSMAWIVIILPTTYDREKVSEVIALKLRRPGSDLVYLYPQLFAGISYLLAGLCLLELFRVRQAANHGST